MYIQFMHVKRSTLRVGAAKMVFIFFRYPQKKTSLQIGFLSAKQKTHR